MFLTGAGIFVYQKGGWTYLSSRLGLSARPPVVFPGSEHHSGLKDTYAIMPERDSAIIFAGDSLTELCPWHELFSNADILGRGISGDTVPGLQSRIDELLRHRPRKLFLMIGINDLLYGKAPEDVLREYRFLIEHIKTLQPDTQLYVQSILPIDGARWGLPAPPNVDADIVRVNETLAKWAGDRFVYVDLYSLMVSDGNRLDARYSSDGIHLSAAGYSKWREALGGSVP
ncbi:MAG: GDSL-type esterase/lipase family protein [Burkholderiales bacterium]|nr:hypothetical protein [Burkholderiales bacterium]MDQ3195381.1 GDSL-type esterase/lipase family protein [Pseudomonadota bacterium]